MGVSRGNIYIDNKPYSPDEVFLHYSSWAKNLPGEKPLRELDGNRDRLISFDEVDRDKLRFVQLTQMPQVEPFYAIHVEAARKQLPKIHWGSGFKQKPLQHQTVVEDEPWSRITAQAKRDLETIREARLDIDGDGKSEYFEITRHFNDNLINLCQKGADEKPICETIGRVPCLWGNFPTGDIIIQGVHWMLDKDVIPKIEIFHLGVLEIRVAVAQKNGPSVRGTIPVREEWTWRFVAFN